MESVCSLFPKKAGYSILLKMNSLSGLMHWAPHTVHIALKLRMPLQIHKTALLAFGLHEAGARFGLRRTRAVWSLIQSVRHLVALNVLCWFSGGQTLAIKQAQFHNEPPPTTKLPDTLVCSNGLKGAYFRLVVSLFGTPERVVKPLTLRRSKLGLTAVFHVAPVSVSPSLRWCP